MYYIIEVAHKNVQVIAQLLFAKDVMASGHRASLLEKSIQLRYLR